MLYSIDEHHHEIKEKVPRSLAQAKIIEYDSFVLKPAQMLIQLRRVADNLPTKTQLSNFLNFHRNKIESIGSSSTQIALNDYKGYA